MYNNNRYSDKVIDVVITEIREERHGYTLYDLGNPVAFTKFDTHLNEIDLGRVNKLHIREDYNNGNSYFLKVI